jgi:hypothetical protein
MGGFGSFISVTIQIWILVLALTFARVLLMIMAPRAELFIPALGFEPLTQAWNAAMKTGQFYILATAIIFIFLWVVYKILMVIFPINLIIKNMTPFRECKQRGLFGLFDACFSLIVSRDGPFVRIKRLIQAIGNFLYANFSPKPMKREEPKPIEKKPVDAKSEDEEKEDPPFSDADIERTNEEFQQCIEENTTLTTPDMTDFQVSATSAKNSFVEMQCKMKAVQSALNNFAYSR